MAHLAQREFCKTIKQTQSEHFENRYVLDCGSLDVNGNNRYLFDNCRYIGCDLGEGKNVDVISPIHELEYNNETFDTIISTECFEHDMYLRESILNIVRMLRSGGLFIFTCATDGRKEHGTVKTSTEKSAPLLKNISYEWGNYYKNVNEGMIRDIIDVDNVFRKYEFTVNQYPPDLYFWGIKV